jgi:predicted ribosome quality control (RQC) complex YloA/Tae2 family protein
MMSSRQSPSKSSRPLDAIVLAQWVAYHQHLVGCRIQKIIHPTPRELLITLRSKGLSTENNTCYISIQKQYPAIFIGSAQQCQGLVQATFSKPTNWCQQLRKHLVGGQITKLQTLPGERVIQLNIAHTNTLGDGENWALYLELMGRHSNIILVNHANDTIVGAAHNVNDSMSQHRHIAPGLPYTLPPPQASKTWLGQAPVDELTKHLANQGAKELLTLYSGAGKHTWQDAQHWSKNKSLPDAGQRLQQASLGQPALLWQEESASNSFTLALNTDNQNPEIAGGQFNQGIYQLLYQQRFNQLQHQYLQAIMRHQRKWQARQDELYKTDDDEVATQANHIGDLLTTHASTQPSSQTPQHESVTLNDWNTGTDITISVDPALTWQANAEAYYKQGRQHRQRKAHQQTQGELLQREGNLIDELTWSLQQATSLDELQAISDDLVEQRIIKPIDKHSKPSKRSANSESITADDIAGLRQLTASDGETIIYVGRQGLANSALLTHLSRPKDWWCHAKDYPGAHVVIRHEGADHYPDDDVLHDGLHLAAYFSSATGDGKLPIVYTQRKHVRKIPNSAPGHVTYKQEYEALITVDEQRIERLLGGG